MRKLLSVFLILPIAIFAQSPPLIPLTGNIGVQGSVAILGGIPVQMPSDANYTLTPAQWSNKTLIITSASSLSATRNIVAPLNKGQEYNIENKTTGGQSIQIIGASGTGVTILNSSSSTMFSDGTNYIQTSGSSGPSLTPAGSDVLQSSNTAGTALAIANTRQLMNTFGRPAGHRHFGDSITFGIGSTSTGPTNAGAYNGYAYIAGRSYGGTFVNYGVSGFALADINSVEMYSNEVPILGGPSYTIAAGTNDTRYGTPSSSSQQNLFSRAYLASLAYAGTANSQKTMAQAATCSSGCIADNTYGQGVGSSSQTNGTSWTFSFTSPKINDSVYACYIVNNAWTTSTFNLALDTVNQNDPFNGTATWSGAPDINPIPTGNSITAEPVCARFTGLASGSHTIKFTVTGTTGITSKVEPLFVVPAPIPSPMNPYIAAISLNLQPTSNASAPFVSGINTIIQSQVTNTAADGINSFYVDTQNALFNSNVSISLPETLSTTTYTQPGWVSDNGVQYQFLDGTSLVPLTKVSSSPMIGQYSVSSGVYTINAADENVALKFNSIVNCGSGSLTTLVANCVFADSTGLHPNNTGHSVMANTEIAAAKSLNLITNSPNPLLSGDIGGGYNLFTSPSPSEWTGPNQFNGGLTGNVTGTGLARGIAWGKQIGGKVWGTTMTGSGITDVAPFGIPQRAWCQYAGAVPTTPSQLDCFGYILAGIFEFGSPSVGNFALGIARNSVIFGQGAVNAPVQSFSPFSWIPQTNATASVNQSSPLNTMIAKVWCSSCGTPASMKSSYQWQVLATNGSENTIYKLTAFNEFGSGTHRVDLTNLTGIDLPGDTTVGGKQIGGSGTATFALGLSAQVGTGPTTPSCAAGYSCNSQAGAIQFTTGTGTLTAGTVLTITTGITRTIFPSCPVSIDSSVYLGAILNTTTTTLTLNVRNALSPSTSYSVIWNCQN